MDNGNTPHLVTMLAEMLGIWHNFSLYIHNAFTVPSEDQFSLEVLRPRTFIKCTRRYSIVAFNVHVLLQDQVAIQRPKRDLRAPTKHDHTSHVIDTGALEHHQLQHRIVDSIPILTSTALPLVNLRTSSKRFRSHSKTWPSDEADNKALNDRDAVRIVTVERCPNRHIFGCRSTDVGVVITAQIEMVQSEPAVTRVLESAKMTYESWPWWTCSNNPSSCSTFSHGHTVQSLRFVTFFVSAAKNLTLPSMKPHSIYLS